MRWIANLKVWQKFALIGAAALAMAVPPTAVMVHAKSDEAAFAAMEFSGLAPAADVLRLMQALQKHRGLSGSVLGGNADLAAAREAAQADTQAALERALASSSPFADDPGLKEHTAGLADEWKDVAAAVQARRLQPGESFERHTRLVSRTLSWLTDVVEASSLALDPEASSYFLIMATLNHGPQLAELLGQMRARGALALTKQALAPDDRLALSAGLAQARTRLGDLQHALKKSGEADAVTGAAMAGPSRDAQAAIDLMQQAVQRDVLGAIELKASAAGFFKTATAAIDAQYALIGAGNQRLGDQLQARLQGARRLLWATLAVVALAFSLGAAVTVAVARGVVHSVREAGTAASALASGDLTRQELHAGRDELGLMTRALGDAMGQLADLVGDVRTKAESVALASQQIASGNLDLSSRTERQASALQQTASAMAQMTASVGQTALNARRAMELTSSANDTARSGQTRFADVAQTMGRISESSRQVAEIVGTIDTIAFQTNLLALNAAVEAARAGSHGRGFAVVAGDVRALAHRSAEAAQRIRGLIAESGERVALGDRQTLQAGTAMTEVVDRLGEVTVLVQQIAGAAEEQSRGIGEVNSAVAEIDRTTQQNAALVEETAAAAGSLSSQADGMVKAMAAFRTGAPAA